jgi:hypothetical protein
MYCLEYRGDNDKYCIQLPQFLDTANDLFAGGRKFYLPHNLYIIGTMNHADRSISGFDMALRRRFAWYKMAPMGWVESYLINKNSFDEESLESFLTAVSELNEKISNGQVNSEIDDTPIPLNDDHQIGDSYFSAIDLIVPPDGFNERRRILPQHREYLWLYHLRPLLEDYLGNDIHGYQGALRQLGKGFIGE